MTNQNAQGPCVSLFSVFFPFCSTFESIRLIGMWNTMEAPPVQLRAVEVNTFIHSGTLLNEQLDLNPPPF